MISPAGSTIPLPQGIAKIVTRGELQNCDAWKRAFQDKCKDHRFYEIIEQTLANDFEHRYLLLEDSAGNVRAIQPLFFVRQNLVEGVPGKVRTAVEAVRRHFPHFLTMRVLMVGCAAGEGHLGACDFRRRAMGGERIARQPADVCAAKQSFSGRAERFSGEIPPGPRRLFPRMAMCACRACR